MSEETDAAVYRAEQRLVRLEARVAALEEELSEALRYLIPVPAKDPADAKYPRDPHAHAPPPPRPPAPRYPGCARACGFVPAGTALQCREGAACGVVVRPEDPEWAALCGESVP